MANELILLDSSILIDFYRKKNKERSLFVQLARQGSAFAVSVITRFELLVGGSTQSAYWEEFFSGLQIPPLTTACVDKAADLRMDLRRRNRTIDLPDLFIAATALIEGLPLATLNIRHFRRIPDLDIYSAPKELR